MGLLQIRNLHKSFGGNHAVNDVSFDLMAGEILGLIGPNGSGKTTVLNMLSGFMTPDAGTVTLAGETILDKLPEQLAHLGVLRMFQMTRVFTRISGFDNLLTAGMAMGLGLKDCERRAHELMAELTLDHVKYLDAGQLSGGQKKLLEFGMCFMVPPKVALLDEPFAAVHPVMREVMANFIRSRHRQGQTFLLVSHDMPIVVELCQRAVCMNAGKVIAMGETREVLQDRAVMEAYLGDAPAEVTAA